jgi:hypothetical protein
MERLDFATLLAYECRLDGVVGVGTLASRGEEGV